MLVRRQGVPIALEHLGEVIALICGLALAASMLISLILGTGERRDAAVVASGVALLVMGCVVAAAAIRMMITGLFVSLDGVRVRQFLATTRWAWGDVASFELAPRPHAERSGTDVVWVASRSGKRVFVADLQFYREPHGLVTETIHVSSDSVPGLVDALDDLRRNAPGPAT